MDKKLKFETGMYDEAGNKGMPFGVWLENHIVEKGLEPTAYYNNGQPMSNYQKAMYRRQLKADNKPIPPDAFEVALKQFGIRAFGTQTDIVAKFFQTSESAVLFPEFISNRVYAGELRAALWLQFVAETVTIQGLEFRKIYLEDTEAQRQTARFTRASGFPQKQISAGKQTVSLEKYGIDLLWDYEVIEQTPLNLISVVLDRVGRQIAIDETDDLFYVLVNGDGNSNGLESAQTVTTATTSTIVKLDIITLAAALPQPYQLNKFVGPLDWMIKYWDALSDMQNPAAQWGMTGMSLPVGYEWDRGVVNTTDDRFFGVDSRYAAGYVTNDAVLLTETDRIIRKQTVETTISKRGVFNVIDQDAIGALDITH